MRKTILFLAILFVSVMFYSCKKETSHDETNNSSTKEIIEKVNAWLDAKKPANKPGEIANVDLLKSNLDFSRLRIEKSEREERIIIIPVNETLKTVKSIDKKAIPNLVLILNSSGNIRKGNLVLYLPESEQANSIPDNTFYKILNTGDPECNGKFRYLSITGRRLHELEYQNGKLKSFGQFKDSSMNHAARTNTNCVDWFWVTTYYDEDWVVIDETWDYIGTTCESESCYDPYAAMLCPMEGSGEGSAADPDMGFEYSVTTDRYWKSYQDLSTPSWYVEHWDQYWGKKEAGNPNGGYFTKIAKLDWYVQGFPTYMSVIKTSDNAYVSSSSSYHEVEGYITSQIAPTQYFTKNNTVHFSELWP